jgi:hypothetical protein
VVVDLQQDVRGVVLGFASGNVRGDCGFAVGCMRRFAMGL